MGGWGRAGVGGVTKWRSPLLSGAGPWKTCERIRGDALTGFAQAMEGIGADAHMCKMCAFCKSLFVHRRSLNSWEIKAFAR